MVSRNPYKTGRPADMPIWAHPTGRDLETRALVVPPSFIDKAVLIGGDEYVRVEDIATIVNAILENLQPILERIETHLSLGSGEEVNKEESE